MKGYLISTVMIGAMGAASSLAQQPESQSRVSVTVTPSMVQQSDAVGSGVDASAQANPTEFKSRQPWLVRRASLAIEQSRYEDGLRWARRAMVADPADANAFLAAASALSGLGDPEGASVLLREAASLVSTPTERQELLAVAEIVFPAKGAESLAQTTLLNKPPLSKPEYPDEELLLELDKESSSVGQTLAGVTDALNRIEAPRIDPDALNGASRVGEAAQVAVARADAAARETREQWSQALAQLGTLNNAMLSAASAVETAKNAARSAETGASGSGGISVQAPRSMGDVSGLPPPSWRSGSGGVMVQARPPATKPPPPPRADASQRECYENQRELHLWAAREFELQGKTAAAQEQRKLAEQALQTVNRLGGTSLPEFRR